MLDKIYPHLALECGDSTPTGVPIFSLASGGHACSIPAIIVSKMDLGALKASTFSCFHTSEEPKIIDVETTESLLQYSNHPLDPNR